MRPMIFTAIWFGAFCLSAPSDEPAQATNKHRVIKTKKGDFRLVSDRDESVADFFRRNRVLLGGIPFDSRSNHGDLQFIVTANAELPEAWLHHASANDDPGSQLKFITEVRISPPTPEAKTLLAEIKKSDTPDFALILIREKEGANVYRPVGYTTHTPVGFFTEKFSGTVEGISAKDLLFGASKK